MLATTLRHKKFLPAQPATRLRSLREIHHQAKRKDQEEESQGPVKLPAIEAHHEEGRDQSQRVEHGNERGHHSHRCSPTDSTCLRMGHATIAALPLVLRVFDDIQLLEPNIGSRRPLRLLNGLLGLRLRFESSLERRFLPRRGCGLPSGGPCNRGLDGSDLLALPSGLGGGWRRIHHLRQWNRAHIDARGPHIFLGHNLGRRSLPFSMLSQNGAPDILPSAHQLFRGTTDRNAAAVIRGIERDKDFLRTERDQRFHPIQPRLSKELESRSGDT